MSDLGWMDIFVIALWAALGVVGVVIAVQVYRENQLRKEFYRQLERSERRARLREVPMRGLERKDDE